MWVKSCSRTARLENQHLPVTGVFVCEHANEKHGCVHEWGSNLKCLCVERGMRSWEGCCFSSCQPLEIPGNVIQSCSLKNHSARNSPGQQRRLGESKRSSSERANIWIIITKIELLCHLYPWCIVSPVALSRKSSLLYVSVKYEVRRLECLYVLCIHTCSRQVPLISYKNNLSMTEWRVR